MIATRKGSIQVYQALTGAFIAEAENAHYLAINDLAVTSDLAATAGKDTKVRVWLLTELMGQQYQACSHLAEFSQAQMEVT